ncbi:hypothetical protein F5144DRAFT_35765 [Chaetomium tenue]|uniref:Uncharacterized protein n=1 Tax=Chaetomium tenue TaxID=1854479 RepID=A0ACB7PPH0_9PEZI|nr:hypothetical protein F5144DRAFT_35765 [Chaetomium globosum]
MQQHPMMGCMSWGWCIMWMLQAPLGLAGLGETSYGFTRPRDRLGGVGGPWERKGSVRMEWRECRSGWWLSSSDSRSCCGTGPARNDPGQLGGWAGGLGFVALARIPRRRAWSRAVGCGGRTGVRGVVGCWELFRG